ncbi:MAG: hypothetical protein HY343_00285 [Lentisphaerae bacterium]|nr:hypothetical protein [Lentisphaerota bacterium]
MDKPFKFKYVNEITGGFVLLAFSLLIVSIFFAGRAQGLFKPKFELRSMLSAKDGSFGLQKGSEVRILDMQAGKIEQVRPLPDGSIEISFLLNTDFQQYLHRKSSKAIVKKKLAGAGDSFVVISVGNADDPRMENGDRIDIVKDVDLTEQLLATLDEFKEAALPMIEKSKEILNEIPPLEVQTRLTLRQGEKLMKEGESLLHNELPAITIQAQDTLREIQTLIAGLERHWLLRKYMEPVDTGEFIAPTSVSPLSKGGRP